jgi:hypothetical protein
LYSPYEAKFGSDAVGFEVDGFRDIFETGDRKVFHVTGKFDLSVPEGPDVEVNLATPRPHEARHFRDNWNLVPPEDKATDWDFSLELARCQTRLELERAEASPGTWKTD